MGADGDGEPEADEPARGGKEMLRDDPAVEQVAGSDADEGGGPERRRAYRRQLPFGRGAVLVVGERAHIVGIADLSVTGAYLRMRLALEVGDVHLLKLLMPPERTELRLRVRVVRVSLEQDESHQHTRGAAVHFLDVTPEARKRLQAFVGDGR